MLYILVPFAVGCLAGAVCVDVGLRLGEFAGAFARGDAVAHLRRQTPPMSRAYRTIYLTATVVAAIACGGVSSSAMLLATAERTTDWVGTVMSALGTSCCWALACTGMVFFTPCPENDDSAVVFMILCTVCVSLMLPALALFEAGLLRKRTTTSIIASVLTIMCCVDVLWVLLGFSLALGPDTNNPFIGDFKYAAYWRIDKTNLCIAGTSTPVNIYSLFQMQFAAVACAIMTGSYAERFLFRPMLIFTMLWFFCVYVPVSHWVWHDSGWLHKLGLQDFAGGLVLHTTAGVGGLCVAYTLGHRVDWPKYRGEPPYSSLPLSTVGCGILFSCWLCFNGGSSLAVNHGRGAVVAVINTVVAGAGGGVAATVWVMYKTNRPSAVVLLNGLICGLAGITPMSGYVSGLCAILCGFLFGLCFPLGVWIFKHKLEIDDALDVSAVHLLPSLVGLSLLGFLGDSEIAGADGLFNGGNAKLLGVQLLGIIVVAAWTAFWTLSILMILRKCMPLRIPGSIEADAGIDEHDFNEKGSNRSSKFIPAAQLLLRDRFGALGDRFGSFAGTHVTVDAPDRAASAAYSAVPSSAAHDHDALDGRGGRGGRGSGSGSGAAGGGGGGGGGDDDADDNEASRIGGINRSAYPPHDDGGGGRLETPLGDGDGGGPMSAAAQAAVDEAAATLLSALMSGGGDASPHHHHHHHHHLPSGPASTRASHAAVPIADPEDGVLSRTQHTMHMRVADAASFDGFRRDEEEEIWENMAQLQLQQMQNASFRMQQHQQQQQQQQQHQREHHQREEDTQPQQRHGGNGTH